uniref:ATP synthase F0 subunit 8 n=1 Tax=Microtendipes umbrosus TaxID=2562924 RepID=UPI0021CC912B|nr:ATP synthase F0 subunit 8 [Microtendipes umbrosus]UWR98447.1 ATP synthase F0 subunit 8 [Microtendipes umbrosus]
MPQMSPMMWLTLFFFFTIVFIFFNILNYFNFIPLNMQKYSQNTNNMDNKNLIWKW